MHIFFSAGEPSGDQHAAHLIEELRRQRPDATFTGFGGPLMERAGCALLYRLTDLAVMFITSAIPHLRTFFRLVRQADDFFRGERPDAVVLVDYPGFNWHIARKAKAAGIPVFFYLPPQLWAWGPWRVKKMRKFVDHVLSGLPFEPDWYARRGIHAEYVGHPFFDEIAEHKIDREFCESLREVGGRRSEVGGREASESGTSINHRPSTINPSGLGPSTLDPQPFEKLLGVLPGSRDKEIERNWPIMLQVLRQVHGELPHVRFEVASYNERQRDRCVELLKRSRLELPIAFHVSRTPEIIEAADCCLMVSGSVSLEMLARAKPACVVYSLTRIANFLKKRFLNVPYITLPNLFAGMDVLPEWVVSGSPRRAVDEISATLCGWLTNARLRAQRVVELRELRDTVMRTGASRNTAAAILRHLPPSVPLQKAA
jgi:lipid-A-disaccharide synthase